jgi:diguanylate cyclase (GGDEF)-like protein
MVNIKPFTPRLNSETFIFLILLGLSLLSSAFPVTFVYGITFSFTSISLFLVFRLFGLPLTILSTLLTFLFIPDGFIYFAYSLLLLAELLFVGVYFNIKKRAKMFFVDGSFWLTIGLAAIFFLNRSFLTGDALYFQICKDILNGLFNVLIADMLLAYFPFYRFLKSKQLNKNNVSIHQFLSHVTIVSIMIPLFLSTLTKTWNTHELITNQSFRTAESTAIQMKKDLLFLHMNNSHNLPRNKLNEIIMHYKDPEFNIIITNDKNEIITTTSSKVPGKHFNWTHIYDVKRIAPDFYEALPKGQTDVFPIIKSRSGKLIYISNVEALSMKIYIQFPNSQYQDQVFKEFLIHLKLSILFSVFTIIFVLVVSRLFMNNLKQLTIVTTDLPRKLSLFEKIDWPQSNISELRMLTQNLKEMAQKLIELFQESTEMNRILTEQTEKLIESEEKLHQLAYYDLLTSLPNRLQFQNHARNLINNSHTGSMAIIFLDLNKFKQVNDTLGHDAGDALLQMTANRLRSLHNRNREVFRISGDEFVILLEVDDRDEISNTLNIISENFSSPFMINGQEISITVSVGISLYPDNGNDLDSLVKCADIAMYVSKEQGGNAFHFYNESMRDQFQERL